MSTLEILSDFENKLLSRREVSVSFMGGSGLITRQSAIEAISSKLGVKKESVQVISLRGRFGNRDLLGNVYVFNNEKDVKSQLRPYMIVRQLSKEERKKTREEMKKAKATSASATPTAAKK
ncbi:MAG: eS24 family ribosomal protein [Nitrososphaerales archaeon]